MMHIDLTRNARAKAPKNEQIYLASIAQPELSIDSVTRKDWQGIGRVLLGCSMKPPDLGDH